MAILLSKLRIKQLWQERTQRAGRSAGFMTAKGALYAATQAPFCVRLLNDKRGQDMTEYALLSGLIASTVIAVVPPMVSIAMHIVELLQKVAEIAMTASGLG